MTRRYTMKYFGTCNGSSVELSRIGWRDWRREQIELPPKGRRILDCQLVALGTCPSCGEQHFAERRIEYKKRPSLHQCGSRCQSAKGPSCECSCGGENHGAMAA